MQDMCIELLEHVFELSVKKVEKKELESRVFYIL